KQLSRKKRDCPSSIATEAFGTLPRRLRASSTIGQQPRLCKLTPPPSCSLGFQYTGSACRSILGHARPNRTHKGGDSLRELTRSRTRWRDFGRLGHEG